MRNIIKQMRLWLDRKNKIHQVKYELQQSYDYKLKLAVFKGLQFNIKFWDQINQFNYTKMFRFKK